MIFVAKHGLTGLVIWLLTFVPVVGVSILSPTPSEWLQVLLTIVAATLVIAFVERVLDLISYVFGDFIRGAQYGAVERLARRGRIGRALTLYFVIQFFWVGLGIAIPWTVVALISMPIGFGVQLLSPASIVSAAAIIAFIRLAAEELSGIPDANGAFHLMRHLAEEEAARPAEERLVDPPPGVSLPRRLASRVRGAWSAGLANKLLEKGDLDGAVAKYRTAIDAARHDPNARMLARMWLIDALLENGRDAEAVPVLRSAVDDALLVPRYTNGIEGSVASEVKLELLKALGDVHLRLDDRAAEHEVRLEQAAAAQADAETDEYIEALLKAATAQVARGRVSEGAAIYEQVIEEAAGRASPRARAFALVPLAHLRFHLGEMDEAWRLAHEAVELRARTGEADLISEAHWLLAFFQLRAGAIEEAREQLVRAIAAAEKSEDDPDRAGRYRRDLDAIPGPFGEARWQVTA